ncbi:MAG: glycosyltransferase, partial [Methanomassiliicoccales archaeon]
LLLELEKHATIHLWHQPGDINDIIRHLKIKPDIVFINEYAETNCPKVTGLETLTIPYALLLYDLHYQFEARNQAIQQLKPQYIFTLYRDRFKQWYPDYQGTMYWFPHHVNINVFKDYELPKDIDYLLMGDVHQRVYPLRYKILQQMQDKPGFYYHPHPGWRNFTVEERSNLYIGEKYAREINRAKLFFTCDSIYKYPLLKYFEVLACKSLLLAPDSSELTDLGFISGVNFVAINEYDFEERAAYYLSHEQERLQIAEQGYEMVRALHSTEKRAIDMVNIFKEILSTSPGASALLED